MSKKRDANSLSSDVDREMIAEVGEEEGIVRGSEDVVSGADKPVQVRFVGVHDDDSIKPVLKEMNVGMLPTIKLPETEEEQRAGFVLSTRDLRVLMRQALGYKKVKELGDK